MVWPFGTARNACKKVSAGGQDIPDTKVGVFKHFLSVFFSRSCLWKYGQLYWFGRVCGHVSKRGEALGGMQKQRFRFNMG